MSPFTELMASDERRTLEFFFVGLKDVCSGDVDREELLYNASVLAHHALVSTAAAGELPTPVNLSAVFDHFVADSTLHGDAGMLESAGAQCLLLAGFFEDQMRGRHNVRWYADLGAGFFGRAAVQQTSPKRALLPDMLSKHLEPWRQRHSRLSRELRDLPYLLEPPAQ